MKKRLLFVMESMKSGGGERSLLSLLQLIDYGATLCDVMGDMFKKHPLQRGCFFFDSLSVAGSRRVCPITSRSYHTHNQSPIDSPFCTSDLSLLKKWGVFL